jgi:putative transposase
MGIARSTYYDRPAVSFDDTALVERMVAISDSFEAYGYRRMQAALRQQGMVINHKKLRRLMREHDLQPRRRRRYVATTDGDHDLPIFPNPAKEIVPDGPDQVWVADTPMWRSRPGSPMSPSSSTPGRARWWAMQLPDRLMCD